MCMVAGACCKATDVMHAQEEEGGQCQGHVTTTGLPLGPTSTVRPRHLTASWFSKTVPPGGNKHWRHWLTRGISDSDMIIPALTVNAS